MTPEEQDCYDALREDNDCLKQENDALAARLAEAEALLQEVYDGRQSLMSVGLVYRIGHTLNHRPG